MSGYITSDPILDKLASNDSALVNRAVLAGAQQIDEAFSSSPARYDIPLDFDSIEDEVLRARFQGRIEQVNQAIAAYILSGGTHNHRGVDNQIVKDYDEVRRWLDKIARGLIGFPYLHAKSAIGLMVAGDYEWGVPTDLYDTEMLDL